jgi:hypothetical protein
MRFHSVAAVALLLAGGSALAFAPASEMSGDELAIVADKGAKLAAFDYDDKAVKPVEAALVVDDKPLVIPAAAVTWEKVEPAAAGDPDLDLAETSIDEGVPPEPAASDLADTQPAVGGPLEEVAVADSTPRPASQNYPPCSPGPGDDNCIQLYEPGVRTALASWTQPTGGLGEPGEAMAAATTTESLNAESLAMASAQLDSIRADGTALASAETDAPAVGGPYEPVDEALTEAEADRLAMNGDGVIDEELGETEDMA